MGEQCAEYQRLPMSGPARPPVPNPYTYVARTKDDRYEAAIEGLDAYERWPR